MFIDTAEQYIEYRKTAKPVIVKGKRDQGVLIPCMNTILVNRALVTGNLYNPNKISDENKMLLLYQSICLSGFSFPIVVIWDEDQHLFIVVDGFHRYLISGPDWLNMKYVPVAVLELDMAQRMTATWSFNKARGQHSVDLDSSLIRSLIQQGLKDEEIAEKLCIDMDTVYRYKQLTGIAEIFKETPYSISWEMEKVEETDDR